MIEFIQVSTGGSHREMGVDFGRAVADMLAEFVSDARSYFLRRTGRDFEQARRHALRYFLPATRHRYPAYLSETHGIAEGSGIPFEDIFTLIADEELSEIFMPIGDGRGRSRAAHRRHSNVHEKPRPRSEHCSSAVIRTADGLLLGHNEDYPVRYRGRLVIVHAEPADAPAFLSLTYPYMLAGPSCGLNAAGLAFAANSLGFPTRRSGLPANFLLRDAFRSTTLAEVSKVAGLSGQLMGNALVIASAKENDAVAVEAVPSTSAKPPLLGTSTMNEGLLVHTNHHVSASPPMPPEKISRSSLLRFRALGAALKSMTKHTLRGLQRALSSTAGGVCSIRPRSGGNVTIASAVLDPKDGIMYVAKRGPGGHGFRPYQLR